MTTLDVAVVGLSAAAHLRGATGLDVRVFGDPMSFWKNHMPYGISLLLSWTASHISGPNGTLTLDAYRAATSNHLSFPLPLEQFVGYGLWFQERTIPDLDRRMIVKIGLDGSFLRITLADGEVMKSRRVVIAGGIRAFAWRPAEFALCPPQLVSHTSDHRDLRSFPGDCAF